MTRGLAQPRMTSGPEAARARWATVALAALGALALLAAAPPGARAQGTGDIPNWPELLPPNPNNTTIKVSPGFRMCRSGSLRCPQRVILEMYERWRPLSHSCDHGAVFALTYLRTTEEFVRATTVEPTFFDDPPWVNQEDAIFAELYFRAADRYKGGRPVPEAWRVGFDAEGSSDLTGVGDLLLGMNAHINRDLAHTLAAVGLVRPGGGSRKNDHDRVNHFLNNLADPLQEELGARYDPYFTNTDGGPSPFDEIGLLQLVRGFRQNAWDNAEDIVNATSDAQRQQTYANIETQATVGAHGIVATNTIPGYGATRDAWCAEHNPPSLRVRANGRRVPVLQRNRVRVRVYADGPARLRLSARIAPAGGKPVARLRAKRVRFDAQGRRRVALPLTSKARRALASLRRPEVRVALRAPYGLRLRDRHALAGRRAGPTSSHHMARAR